LRGPFPFTGLVKLASEDPSATADGSDPGLEHRQVRTVSDSGRGKNARAVHDFWNILCDIR
jgi:hypothetical protein